MAHAGGRPSKYREEMCETVVACMKKGYIVDEVCAELDIARDTFFRWAAEHEEFSDAYKKGRTFFNAFAARMYRNAMLEVPITKESERKTAKKITKKDSKKGNEKVEITETGNVEFKANPAMMIFYMKAHCGWSETVVNKVDANITVDPQTDQKLREVFNREDERKTTEKNKR